MKTRKYTRMLITLLLVVLMAVPGYALAGVKGVGVTDMIDEVPTTYEQMVSQLYSMERKSRGSIDVFTLADRYGSDAVSEAGRDLYVAKMGDGDRVLWIHAQIHGNEKLTTPALLDFMWDYAYDKSIRDEYKNLTIYAIPMYNPDGSILGQRGTQIIDEDGTVTAENFDLNRDWKLDTRGEGMGFQASESRAYYKLFCDIQPDWAFDLHHQGAKKGYGSDVNSVTGSLGVSLAVDGPTLPNLLDGKYNTQVKQMQKYIYDQIIDEVRSFSYEPGIGTAFDIDLYARGSDIDILGGVVSGMLTGLNYEGQNPDNYSCPATFFETESFADGSEPIALRSQKLIEQIYLAVYAFVDGQATGDYLTYDPEDYWDIPHYPVTGYSPDYDASLPEVDYSYLEPDGRPITSVKIVQPEKDIIRNGVSMQLSVNLNRGASEYDLVWSVDNPEIATVSANGLVKASDDNDGVVIVTAASPNGKVSHTLKLIVV